MTKRWDLEVIETIKKLVAIPSVTGAAPEPGKPYGPYVYEALETALERFR